MTQEIFGSALLCVALLTTGCGRSASSSHADNVFGTDDREALTSDELPWRAVGRLVGPTGGICTATLVARNYIVTAAHCVIDSNTGHIQSGEHEFQPNYKNGASVMTVAIDWFWWGSSDPNNHRGADWAILRTETAVGDQYGWLPMHSTTLEDFPLDLSVAGYSGDFQAGKSAGLARNCHVKGRDTVDGLIMHDCDTTRGASGGPATHMLNGQTTIFGINVAERRDNGDASLFLDHYDDTHANLVVPSEGAVKQLRTILTSGPGPSGGSAN